MTMNATRLPVAVELFTQWQRARGGRNDTATRPFTRGWEQLLEDAGIVSATDRSDAERDARALAAAGWLELKHVCYRPQLIDRIAIPLAAEPSWCEAFGFVTPSDEEMRQISQFAWAPELMFVRGARMNLSFADLKLLNDFIKNSVHERELIPIKERSLQIFGDEKRLDALLASALFREGRLGLQRDLRCEVIGVPLGWKRGPLDAGAQPIIVIENAATWHSYSRWNAQRSLFSAVVYGEGNRFVDGIRYLADIFAELGGHRRMLYFGDLDPQGLRIPRLANAKAVALGLPAIEPDVWSYRRLLEVGRGKATPMTEPVQCDEQNVAWLGELAGEANRLFAQACWLPQEHVSWEVVQSLVWQR